MEIQDQNNKIFCRRHEWMVKRGLYKEETHTYLRNCGSIYCQLHHLKARKFQFKKKFMCFGSFKFFYPLILHFTKEPRARLLAKVATNSRKIIKQWLGDCKVYVVVHPLEHDWHLNIGIECNVPNLFSRKNNFGNRCGRGFHRRKYKCWRDVLGSLSFQVRNKKEGTLNVRKGKKKYRNEKRKWLNYVLRTLEGMKYNEILPQRCGYRSFWGFINKRKKQMKKLSVIR